MKKNIFIILSLLICIFAAAGCGSDVSGDLGKDGRKLVGTWNGVGNAVGKSGKYSCDNLSFSIEKDGSFSIKDVAKNSTCLSGALSAGKDSSFSLQSEDPTGTGLPKGWKKMGSGSEVSYTMPTNHAMILTFKDVSYFFEKQKNESSKTSGAASTPLLNLAENDVWYSRKETKTTEPAFELCLYDKYMELNSVDPDADSGKARRFLMNFFYLTSRDNTFTFYTYRDGDTELPDFLSDLPEGFSTVKIRIHAENDALTLSRGDQELKLYNNVRYNEKFHKTETKKTAGKKNKTNSKKKDSGQNSTTAD